MPRSPWQPDKSRLERMARSINSMIPGSMSGRVAEAMPVPQYLNQADSGDDDDDELTIASLGLNPMTDYFTVEYETGGFACELSFPPYIDEIMAERLLLVGHEDRVDPGPDVSLHVYWNNTLLPDHTYRTAGTWVLINDPEHKLRPGDTITCKYFFMGDGGGGGGGAIVTTPLEVALTGVGDYDPASAAAIFGGFLVPVGFRQGGSIVLETYDGYFGTYSSWAMRLPPGHDKIPEGDDWETIFLVNWSGQWNFTSYSAFIGGGAPWGLVGHWVECHFVASDEGEYNPPILPHLTPSDFGNWMYQPGSRQIPYTKAEANLAVTRLNLGYTVPMRLTPNRPGSQPGGCVFTSLGYPLGGLYSEFNWFQGPADKVAIKGVTAISYGSLPASHTTRPVAIIKWKQAKKPALTINFDGSRSYDPDGAVVTYDWAFGDGDTISGTVNGGNNDDKWRRPTHTYASAGRYLVRLTVTDDEGQVSEQAVEVVIVE